MRMPFGKYRGVDVEDVPVSYLVWLLTEGNIRGDDLRDAIRETVRDRLDLDMDTVSTTVVYSLPPTLVEKFNKMYRKASLLCHPDRGGDTETMQLLNEVRDLIRGTTS